MLNVEVLSSDGQVVRLRDSEDDFYRAEEFGIDLTRRPGADSFAALDEDLSIRGASAPADSGQPV